MLVTAHTVRHSSSIWIKLLKIYSTCSRMPILLRSCCEHFVGWSSLALFTLANLFLEKILHRMRLARDAIKTDPFTPAARHWGWPWKWKKQYDWLISCQCLDCAQTCTFGVYSYSGMITNRKSLIYKKKKLLRSEPSSIYFLFRKKSPFAWLRPIRPQCFAHLLP